MPLNKETNQTYGLSDRYFRSQIRSTNYWKKKRKYVSSDNQPWTENTWGEENVHTSAWDLKRQYKVSNFGLKAEIRYRDVLVTQIKGEIRWSLKQRREVRWSLQRRERPAGHSSTPVSSPCVFFGRRNTSQKGFPSQKKDMCEFSLTVFLLHKFVVVEE